MTEDELKTIRPVGLAAILGYSPTFNPPLQRPTTSCEKDKPIGTRDPDKFLREERDKGLGEVFG